MTESFHHKPLCCSSHYEKIFLCATENEKNWKKRKKRMHVKPFYILILLLCFVFFTISAANPYDDYSSDISSLSESHIPPLWQEEPHFIYYRILLVNEKINRLEQTIDNIGDKAYRPKAILFYVEDARELIKMMRMILGICDTTGCLE